MNANCEDIMYIIRKHDIPDNVASEILAKLHEVIEKEEQTERNENCDPELKNDRD